MSATVTANEVRVLQTEIYRLKRRMAEVVDQREQLLRRAVSAEVRLDAVCALCTGLDGDRTVTVREIVRAMTDQRES